MVPLFISSSTKKVLNRKPSKSKRNTFKLIVLVLFSVWYGWDGIYFVFVDVLISVISVILKHRRCDFTVNFINVNIVIRMLIIIKENTLRYNVTVMVSDGNTMVHDWIWLPYSHTMVFTCTTIYCKHYHSIIIMILSKNPWYYCCTMFFKMRDPLITIENVSFF